MGSLIPVSRLINVTVSLTPNAAQPQNLSALLILGSSSVIDVVSRIRSYGSITAVAADFGTSAPEYLAAVLWFEQTPQPATLYIGRWAKTATSAQLVGGKLSAAQQAISVWNAITNGGFTVTVDGTTTHYTGMNFTTATNLNAVASIINGVISGATIAWNSVYGQFTLTDNSTGITSILSFLSTPTSGTDISAMLMMQNSSSQGAYLAQGIAPETALAAVTLFDQSFGQSFYGLMVIGAATSDHLAIAPYIEADTTRHLYGVTTQDPNVLVSGSTSDIAYQLSQLAYNHTLVQYSSSNPYAAASLFGRAINVNYAGSNTVITLMYKQEPGIVPESISVAQLNAAEAKNANVFVSYNNNTAIIENGVCCSGQFIDVITGTDWLSVDIQNSVYNLLYTTTTKIPQTDAGMNQIKNAIEAVCAQAVVNGLLAPGAWNAPGFGSLKQGDTLSKGYYVYCPTVASQPQANRSARMSVPFQVAAKLAGAVHTVSVLINVNQ